MSVQAATGSTAAQRNVDSQSDKFTKEILSEQEKRDIKEMMQNVSSMSFSESDLMDVAHDVFTSDSPAKQNAFNFAMSVRTRIQTAISNLMQMLHQAAMNIVRNLRM